MSSVKRFSTCAASAAARYAWPVFFSFGGQALAEDVSVSPELTARIAKEKEDRKAYKTDICKPSPSQRMAP